MLGLITDRDQTNVDRLKVLSAKGWENMTVAERAEWTGDPLKATECGYTSPVNLIRTNANEASTATLVYTLDSMIVTAPTDGTDFYAISVIGDAVNFEGKTVTLSVEKINAFVSATPLLSLYWYDSDGWEFAGGDLSQPEGKTFTLSENTQNRAKLALFLYVALDGAYVETGTTVKYVGTMLEFGEVQHSYVPYSPMVPTSAVKGAYNHSDLNRVEMAVSDLSVHLGLGLETKTDWLATDIPNRKDMDRYFGNIRAIQGTLPESANIFVLPTSARKMNYDVANTIEKILLAAYQYTNYPYRSGELHSGEV